MFVQFSCFGFFFFQALVLTCSIFFAWFQYLFFTQKFYVFLHIFLKFLFLPSVSLKTQFVVFNCVFFLGYSSFLKYFLNFENSFLNCYFVFFSHSDTFCFIFYVIFLMTQCVLKQQITICVFCEQSFWHAFIVCRDSIIVQADILFYLVIMHLLLDCAPPPIKVLGKDKKP